MFYVMLADINIVIFQWMEDDFESHTIVLCTTRKETPIILQRDSFEGFRDVKIRKNVLESMI